MIFFLIAGIVIILIGILLIVTSKAQKSRCTSTTIAKVVDIDREKSQSLNNSRRDMQYGNHIHFSIGDMNINLARNNYNYNTIFYPIIEYQVGDKKYVKKSSYGSSSSNFAIGDETEIHYNPNDPNEFYITESGSGIMGGVVFTIIGIILIGTYICTLFA